MSLGISVGQPIPDAPKVPGTLTHTLDGATTEHPIRIERRGGYSMSYAKHSYEVKLAEDAPIGGLPADDDWILNANYVDKTFLRHAFSYDLFRRMSPDNRAARYRFAPLTVNGDYQGLYVVMQKLDRSSLGVEKRGETTFIFKEPHVFRESYVGLVAEPGKTFHHQTFPKARKGDRAPALEHLRALILHADDTDFDRQLPELIDVANFTDWHLLLLLTNNQDGLLKNFYLYKPTDRSPVRVAPWDYDHSFGRDGDNERNLNERKLDANRNLLFRRLLARPWYVASLKARWAELQSDGIFTTKTLISEISDLAERLRPLAHRNVTRWPVDAEAYYDANDFDAEIELMKAFVALRHAYLEGYFASL